MNTTHGPELLTGAVAVVETTPACPSNYSRRHRSPGRAGSDVWDRLKAMVLHSVASPHSRRSYETALNEFFHWWNAEGRLQFVKATVQAFRARMKSDELAPATSRLQREQRRVQDRIDAMYVDRLDGRIDNDFFDRKAADFWAEQVRIMDDIAAPRTPTTHI